MDHKQAPAPQIQFDMMALSRWQIRLLRMMIPLVLLLILILPPSIMPTLLPAGWLGLAPVTLGILLSMFLWSGCGFLLWALFRGCAMASAAQQQELQRLFADYPELHAYRERVAALGRGFTVGEHETLMAWPAMKAAIADDLDSAV